MVIQPQNTHSNERCRPQQGLGLEENEWGGLVQNLEFRVSIPPHFLSRAQWASRKSASRRAGQMATQTRADSGPAEIRTLLVQVIEPYKWT